MMSQIKEMNMLRPITKKQKKLMDYLIRYVMKNGEAPTQKEMSEHMRFGHQNQAQQMLWSLEKRGLINRIHGQPRGIEIV